VIALIDYKAGNLTSVKKALATIGAEVFVPEKPDDLADAAGIIVPGVGHFAATRALDRVLLSGFYVVPLYFPPVQWVARWARIAHPSRTSLFGYLPETWWQKDLKP